MIEASCLQHAELVAPIVSTFLFEQQKISLQNGWVPYLQYGDTKLSWKRSDIDALAQFRGESNIALLVGVVITENPYKTCPSTDMSSCDDLTKAGPEARIALSDTFAMLWERKL